MTELQESRNYLVIALEELQQRENQIKVGIQIIAN